MSNTGEWKNDRAEASMKEHEAQMMAKLNPKTEKTVTKTWIIKATAMGEWAEQSLVDFEAELMSENSILNRVDGIAVSLVESDK